MKFRPGLHAGLFSLFLVQGILSSIAYSHTQNIKVLVFSISSLVLALYEISVFFIHSWFGSLSSIWLLPVCAVTYAFFLASTFVVIVSTSTVFKDSASEPSLFAPAFIDGNSMAVVLSLAFVSVFLMGISVSFELMSSLSKSAADEDLFASYSDKSAFLESKAGTNFHPPPEPVCPDSYSSPDLTPMSMQTEFKPKTLDNLDHYGTPRTRWSSGVQGFVHNPSPPVSFPSATHDYINKPLDSYDIFRSSDADKCLKNKDSEKTLAEYDVSEEMSVDLLVRASMACVDLYDGDIDNWMNTKAESTQYPKLVSGSASETPKDNIFHSAGALKIKKLRSKKSLNNAKTESLPTLQETTSNHADSPDRLPQLMGQSKMASEEPESTEINSERYPKSAQPKLENNECAYFPANSEIMPVDSSDSQTRINNFHRKSNSWSSSIFHSPARTNFNVFQSSNALKEFRSVSPKKSIACSPGSSNSLFLNKPSFSPKEPTLKSSNIEKDVSESSNIEKDVLESSNIEKDVLESSNIEKDVLESSNIEKDVLESSKDLLESPKTQLLQESPELSQKIPISDLEKGLSFDSDVEDIEEITQPVPNWKLPSEPDNSIRNVSLEYWEANKDNWISGPQQSRPLVYTSSTIDARQGDNFPRVSASTDTFQVLHADTLEIKDNMVYDGTSIRSISAPSLHTYRDLQDVQSKRSGNTFSNSEHTLYRPSTPPAAETSKVTQPLAYHGSQRSLGKNQFPYQSQANFSKSDSASQETSPIRKMIGKLKMSGESSFNMHKHSSSLANSMISSTSGLSSKSGSPKKVIKNLFTRSSFDQGKRLSFSNSMTSPTASSQRNKASMFENNNKASMFENNNKASMFENNKASMFENNVSNFNFGAKNEKHALDKFWEFEATDSDKSRVSSMPSAIIGEYDKEKWRTLKTLEMED